MATDEEDEEIQYSEDEVQSWPAKEKWEEEQPRRQYGKTCLYIRSAVARQKRNRQADALACKLYAVMPWLTKVDGPLARRWSQLEYLGDMVFLELTRNGILSADGEPRRLLSEFRKLVNNQLQVANALGMSATARAALGITRAQGIDEQVKAAEARIAALDSENPSEQLPVPLNGISDCDADE